MRQSGLSGSVATCDHVKDQCRERALRRKQIISSFTRSETTFCAPSSCFLPGRYDTDAQHNHLQLIHDAPEFLRIVPFAETRKKKSVIITSREYSSYKPTCKNICQRVYKRKRAFDGTSPSRFHQKHLQHCLLFPYLPKQKRKSPPSRHMYMYFPNLEPENRRRRRRRDCSTINHDQSTTKKSSQVPIRHRRPRQPLLRCLIATPKEAPETHPPTSLLIISASRRGTTLRK